MRSYITSAILMFGLAGCTSLADADAPSTSASALPSGTSDMASSTTANDRCGASKVQAYIGQEATVPVRIEVARVSGAASDRWLYPDSITTKDYRIDRLNVMLEKETNVIVSAKCG